LVSLVRRERTCALDQTAVDIKTNEVTATPVLLAGRDVTATITTMDV
jgi:hypothetical protein